MSKRSRLSPFDEDAEELPITWTDEVLVHTFRRNGKNSITAICHINLYDNEGNCYSAERVVVLKKRD